MGLTELRIANLGVIASAELELGRGLTAITGETGAGKTMLLTGLGMLLGAKIDAAAVREGTDSALVEGRLELPDDAALRAAVEDTGAVIDDDGTIVLARSVSAAGRSRAHLGGRSVPQAVLAEVTSGLITVHGQADQTRLRTPQHQRAALDAFGDREHQQVLSAYRAVWTELASAAAQLAELRATAQQRATEAELLRLSLADVEKVAPQPGEDVELAATASRLGHAEDLRQAAAQAHELLAGEDLRGQPSATVLLEEARRAVEHGGRHDPVLSAMAERIAELGYLASDVATELASYLAELHGDPAQLEAVQQRRAELTTLTRAHSGTVDDVLAWAEQAAQRLAELDGGQDTVAELTARCAELEAELARLAADLGAGRRRAAQKLSAAVSAELGALAMADASVEVALTDVEPGPHGAQQVELMLAPHRGAAPRPVAKAASGGELSRVMLAMEVALAGTGQLPQTFVFDEVDAGIGGRAAIEVGRRLAALARHTQVVVVTHLAQVAAFADRHLVVAKSTDGAAVTVADVRAVDGQDRVTEVARLLSGQDGSEAARTHAAELLAMGAWDDERR